MAKRIAALYIYLWFLPFFSGAQNMLSGTVSDSLTHKPLALVSVRLLTDKQTMVSGAVTDKAGAYRFVNVQAGNYRLQFSLGGYTGLVSAFFTVTDSSGLSSAVFVLSHAYRDLGIVTVRSQRPVRQRIDGFIYNAKDDVQVPGEKASDMLRRLPGVMVSPEGTPSINGSSRIKVFIDNRPSNLFAASVADALQLVSADNISTIEIITHPGAKYEGEGVDGVINITTKRPVENLASGNINTMIANRNIDITGNALIKRNKVIFAADVSYYTIDISVAAQLQRQGMGVLSGSRLNQQRFSTYIRDNKSAGTSFTCLKDSLTTFTASYRISRAYNIMHHTLDNILEASGTIDVFTRITNNPVIRWGHTASAGFYRKSRDRKTEFNLLASGSYQPANDSYFVQQAKGNAVDYRENNYKISLNRELAVQADYTKEYVDKSKLETGGRLGYRNLNSGNDFEVFNFVSKQFTPDVIRTADFSFTSTIAATYLSYAFTAGSYKIRTGIRYEHTRIPLYSKNIPLAVSEYGNMLPNILINRSYKGGHTLTLGYARRLERPFIVYLNPLINYTDSLNIEFGNPALKPVLLNNFTFNYNYQKNGLYLTSALFVNRSVNNIEYVRTLKPGGGTESSWRNISNNTVYGASVNLSFQGKRFSFNLNNTVRSVFFNTDGTLPSKTGWVYLFGSNFSYKFDHGYTLMSFITLNSDNVNFQGSSTGTRWYNILLIKSFNEGRLTVAARFDNFFNQYQYITEKITAQSFTQASETRNIYRFFKFSMSWKIGKKEIKVPATRSIPVEN